MNLRLLPTIAALIGAAALAPTAAVLLVAPASAAVDGVACAMISEYTAPDPAGPTPGTITIGLDQAETIAASADISPAAASALPNLVFNSPTCLQIEADGAGVITSLDFASIGTVCGEVVYDAANDLYVVARAFVVGAAEVDVVLAFQVLFRLPEATGNDLCVTFLVDPTQGFITGFSGTTSVCGAAAVNADGSVQLGAGLIPASVPTANGRSAARIAQAAGTTACAEITASGTVNTQTGELATQVTATFSLDHCGIVEDGAPGFLVVDGVQLQPASGNVERSVQTGMAIWVSDQGVATVNAAEIAGCTSFAAPTPAPTASATPEPSASATPEPSASATPEPAASASPDPSQPAAGQGGDTLPDTAVGSPGDAAWVVMLALVFLAMLGVRSHRRHLAQAAPARARGTRWVAS